MMLYNWKDSSSRDNYTNQKNYGNPTKKKQDDDARKGIDPKYDQIY
jgi:hypothetical protein